MAVADNKSILKLSACDLAKAIATRKYTAVQVLAAYKTRAEEIHHATNCITAWAPDAEAAALACDEHLERTGKTLGPLHGVPFSVKDHIAVKGLPLTMGLQKLRLLTEGPGKVKRDAALVLCLQKAGAVLFAKTTMSQLGETGGGGSPAYGDTLNPWDTTRTPGGSSCGEGALVGGGGSPLGFGSDVAGSVRLPSAFNGLAGLRPTAKRMTFNQDNGRLIMGHPGNYGVLATAGPMARTVDDLVVACQVLWCEGLWRHDPYMPPLPFNKEAFQTQEPLNFGYYISGEYVYPAPCAAVERALKETLEQLQAAGHSVTEFLPATDKLMTLDDVGRIVTGLGLLGSPNDDSTGSDNPLLEGEEHHPDWIAVHSGPPADTQSSLPISTSTTIPEYMEFVARRDKVRDRFTKAMSDRGIDVIVCPAFSVPAPPVEELRNLAWGARAVQVYNILDFPAGVVPVTSVSQSDLAKQYDPRTDDKKLADAARRAVQGSIGLPIAVQVVALPWREETLLRAMSVIEKGASFDKAQHVELQPVPRRCPALGEAPQPLQAARL